MYDVKAFDLNFPFKDNTEFTAVVKELENNGYDLFHHKMVGSALRWFGVAESTISPADIFTDHNAYFGDDDDESVSIFPELLLRGNSLVTISPFVENVRIVIVFKERAEDDIAKGIIDGFIAAIKKKVDGRRTKSWEPIADRVQVTAGSRRQANSRFDELLLSPVSYTSLQNTLAGVLSNDQVRGVVHAITKSGKVKIDDAVRDFDAALIQRLKDVGLLKTEYLVQCRGNSVTLCTTPNKSDFLLSHGAGMKCPHCSRLFKDELILDIIGPSDECKVLLNKSHWMTIWVTSIIESAGIDRTAISWNACLQSDEIDIIADVSGSKLFFELKDREFGLGDAYPFNFRVNRFGGNYGIIVTTDKVSGEAEKFFKEQSGGKEKVIKIYDKDSEMQTKLPEFIAKLVLNAAARQAIAGLNKSSVIFSPMIKAWLLAK